MPTIFEAKIDGSNAIRYFHFSLVEFYLEQAYVNSTQAKEDQEPNHLLASSIMGIMFSAMALEAFANEISEEIIPKEDLKSFIHLRKGYKKLQGESSVLAKLRILFKEKFNHDLDSDAKSGLEKLTSLRNNLVHYKLSDLAGKYIMPPVGNMDVGGGQKMLTIDFMQKPERVEPPFIQEVTGDAALECFNHAYSVIETWNSLISKKEQDSGNDVSTR
ncbi:hypothetical protein [Spongiibacter tropicus]|uniref:hypothetical protein n=1 Tax=Spongiibacter tropicus TaxID=454602 RepID=UPI0003B4FD35|nr:hypothetical protein [Spongiibacter tropicus]